MVGLHEVAEVPVDTSDTQTGLGGWSVSVVGLIGVVCAVLAGATIWLMLTDPVTMVSAIDEGEVSPLIRELAQVLFNAVSGLLGYL